MFWLSNQRAMTLQNRLFFTSLSHILIDTQQNQSPHQPCFSFPDKWISSLVPHPQRRNLAHPTCIHNQCASFTRLPPHDTSLSLCPNSLLSPFDPCHCTHPHMMPHSCMSMPTSHVHRLVTHHMSISSHPSFSYPSHASFLMEVPITLFISLSNLHACVVPSYM